MMTYADPRSVLLRTESGVPRLNVAPRNEVEANIVIGTVLERICKVPDMMPDLTIDREMRTA
jgi:hypothetical protein